jgi:hypothetical protein
MTAKEKADMLYWKYYQLVADGSHPEEKAKESALITVQEIIKALRKGVPEIGLGTGYWASVKQEIESL